MSSTPLSNKRRALVAALLLASMPSAWGRLETGTFVPGATDAERWLFIGKFGFGIGKGNWTARARAPDAKGEVVVRFDAFLDEDWPRVAALPKCSPAIRDMARTHQEVKAGNEWTSWNGGHITNHMRTHIWYVTVSVCPTEEGSSQNATSSAGVDYGVHFVQDGDSELSFELQLMPIVTLLVVLCLSCFLLRFGRQCLQVRQSLGALHPVIQALAVAVLLQWSAEVLHLSHLHFYERQGFGESAFEAGADMLFMLSQVSSCTLLIAIAKGYALVKEVGISSLKFIAGPVAVLHAVLVGHGSMQGDHVDKHHANGGATGLALVAVRLVLFACFVAYVGKLQQQSQSLKLRSLLTKFQVGGSVYFLSYPAIYLLVQVFAPYLQHPILHVGTAAMQTSVAFWLANLFLSKGTFFQVSALSSSLLPGSFGGSVASLKRD